VTDWNQLNLNYVAKAKIDQDFLHLVRAMFAALRRHVPPGVAMSRPDVSGVIDDECVACNLCVNVCPRSRICISMVELPRAHGPAYRKTRRSAYCQLDDAPEQNPFRTAQSETFGPRRYFAGAAGVSNVENISCR